MIRKLLDNDALVAASLVLIALGGISAAFLQFKISVGA